MKALLVVLACLVALGCEISPVVSAPLDTPGARYSDCDRAAEDYCRYAVKAGEQEMDACVAEYRFKCMTSGARSSSPSQS